MASRAIAGSTALVVGGAGFVGSNLVRALLSQEVGRIVIVDNLLSSTSENIPTDPRVSFIFGSIADQRVLNQMPHDLDLVWHLACFHGNQSSIADPIADHDNNTLTSLMLFDHLSKQRTLPKVVYAAAGCAVAEKTEDAPRATLEDAPISLFHDSPYSISKIVGEMYGNYYFTQYGLPFVRARFQNVYGPHEVLGAGQWRGTSATVWRNVIPTFIWRALNGAPLNLDNEGMGSRDFIYVDDLVRGLVACATQGAPGQAYNLASGHDTTIRELAELILRITGSKSDLRLGPPRDWDNSGRRFGSVEKSAQQLNFNSRVELQQGLESTLAWTIENKNLIERCVSQHARLMAATEGAYLSN